jgi:hypothetical protein
MEMSLRGKYFMKRSIGIMLLLFFSLSLAQAGGPDWSAWLYDRDTRHVWQVNEAGQETDSFMLPIPEAEFRHLSEDIGISHNGTFFAYFVQSDVTFDYRFQLYNRTNQTMYSGIFEPPSSVQLNCENCGFQRHSLDIHGGHQVFSADDRWLAISFQSDDTWEIHVIDLQRDFPAIAYTLRHSDLNVQGTTAAQTAGFALPVIQLVTDTQVWFTYLNSMEGAGRFESFVWDFSTGNFVASDRFPQISPGLFEPTGESLANVMNLNLPNQLDQLIGLPLQFNVLEAYTLQTGAFVIYNNAGVNIYDGEFARNGAHVLITEQDYQLEQMFWLLRDRNGNTLDRRAVDWQYNSLAGVNKGFIIMATNLVGDGRGVLALYDTRDGSIRPSHFVWTAPLGQYPKIVAVDHYVMVNPNDLGILQPYSPNEIVQVPILPTPTVQIVIPTIEPTVAQQVIPTLEPTVAQQVIPTLEPTVAQQVVPTIEPTEPTIILTPPVFMDPTIQPPTPELVALPTIEFVPIATLGLGDISLLPTLSRREFPYVLLDDIAAGTLIPSGMTYGFELPINGGSWEVIRYTVDPTRLTEQRTDVSYPSLTFRFTVRCDGEGSANVRWGMSAAQILNADHACGESIDHTFRYDDNGIYVNVVNSGIQAATYRVDALLLD